MSLDFTAIDFETANGFRGSPCAVGLSKVRGGVIVEEASWLMRPPENHDSFDYHNVRIHGIRPEKVAGLPRFGELFPEIGAFIGGDILAAHNAAFDLGVIRSGLEVSGLPGPAYDYVCTVMLSRRCYSLVSNSLPFAAEEAGVPLVNHHDAAEDARACAGILIDIAARNQANSIAELYLSLGLSIPQQPAFHPTTASLRRRPSQPSPPRTAPVRTVPGPSEADGRRKGRTPYLIPTPNPATRCSARRSCSPANWACRGRRRKRGRPRWGAKPESRVTARTSVLVVGDGFVAGDLRSGRLTGKAKRVLELHERGQSIEVFPRANSCRWSAGTPVTALLAPGCPPPGFIWRNKASQRRRALLALPYGQTKRDQCVPGHRKGRGGRAGGVCLSQPGQ